jgi:hypothetical protein
MQDLESKLNCISILPSNPSTSGAKTTDTSRQLNDDELIAKLAKLDSVTSQRDFVYEYFYSLRNNIDLNVEKKLFEEQDNETSCD